MTDCLQVTKLCGPEPLTKYLVTFVVSLQIFCGYMLRDTPVFSWPFFLTAYVIGATANQNLFLAIHEISHNLAFKSGLANRVFAVFANLPIGIPYSASFRVSTIRLQLQIIRANWASLTTSLIINLLGSMVWIPTSQPPLKPSSSTPCLAKPSSVPSRSFSTPFVL